MVTMEQVEREAAKRKALRNPQAFPTHPDGAHIHDGMTLRDYFAAKAMQGLIAASGDADGCIDYSNTAVAQAAYLMANAMLKVRNA
jgi:hypothetical protein